MRYLLLTFLIGTITLSDIAMTKQYSGEILLGDIDRQTYVADTAVTVVGLRGTYEITEYIGCDVSYLSHGKDDITISDISDLATIKMAYDAIKIGVNSHYTFNKHVSLYARIGYSLWTINTTLTYDSVNFPSPYIPTLSGEDLYYGMSVVYNINATFFTGVEYTLSTYDINTEYDVKRLFVDDTVDMKTWVLTVGMRL